MTKQRRHFAGTEKVAILNCRPARAKRETVLETFAFSVRALSHQESRMAKRSDSFGCDSFPPDVRRRKA